MNISLPFRQTLLNFYFGRSVGITPPATLYLGAFTTLPANPDGSGGVEASGGLYARKAVANNSTNFPDADSSAIKKNGQRISFSDANGSWGGPIVGIGLFDASSGGNPIVWWPVTPVVVTNNRTAYVEVSTMQIQAQ